MTPGVALRVRTQATRVLTIMRADEYLNRRRDGLCPLKGEQRAPAAPTHPRPS